MTNNNQQPKNHTNSTRKGRMPLKFFPPVAKYIFSAIQFIAQVYTIYINSYPKSETNPTDEQTLQYIYYITKQNAYDKDFIHTTNFITATNTQTKLQIHITSANSYIHLILDKLDKFFNSNNRLTNPKSI